MVLREHVSRTPMSAAPLSPNLLSQLLNTTDCAVVMLDEGQVIRYANDAVERVFGYAPEELAGQSLDVLLPPAAIAKHKDHVREFGMATHSASMAHRKPVHGRRRNGEIFLATVGISTLRQDGKSWCAAIVSDLSPAISAQNELRDKTEAIALMEERARLARIFQDIAAQTLFSAKISAEVLPKVIRRDQDEAIQLAEAISRMTAGAMAQLRIVLVELLEGEIAANPIESLIQVLADACAARIGRPIAVAMRVHGQPPIEVRRSLYRIAQEALHNAATHSAATRISIDFTVTPNQAGLIITDDGRGAPVDRIERSTTGIRVMREQAQLIDARLDIWSGVGQGTRVSLTWSTA
jgi:PAS domain S-box-containing protein